MRGGLREGTRFVLAVANTALPRLDSKVKSDGSHPAEPGEVAAHPTGAEPPSSQSLEGEANTGFVIAIATNHKGQGQLLSRNWPCSIKGNHTKLKSVL